MTPTMTETITMTSKDKKEKKDKKSRHEGEHKSKKRHHDLEDGEDRKHKRSKSSAPDDDTKVLPIRTESASAFTDEVAVKVEENESKKEKKRKRRKSQPTEPSTDATTEPPTQHKPEPEVKLEALGEDVIPEEKQGKKPKRKHKKRHEEEETVQTEVGVDANVKGEVEVEDSQVIQPEEDVNGTTSKEKKRKEKKDKHRKRHAEKQAESDEVIPETQEFAADQTAEAAETNDDAAMDIDISSSAASRHVFGQVPVKPYPFFVQTVSQYIPLYPVGIIEPLEGAVDQHIKPLLNRYAPVFKGVLLGYRNPRLGETPGASSLTSTSNDDDEVLIESINEYAAPFAWLTVEVETFQPSRGAWCEGKVNLQSEGHLGVVCWGLFNASIEAARLPKGWRWKSLQDGKEGNASISNDAQLPTPEPLDDGHMHTTGYWVDDKGQRVQGTVRFRIQNFDVGGSGEYLSIEGTMLDEEAERELAAEEKEKARRRKFKQQAIGSWRYQKHLPEFSMTKFGAEDEQGDASKESGLATTSQHLSELKL